MKRKSYYEAVYDVKTWLGIHVSHLSYTRNLILTLSIAALTFAFTRYENVKSGKPCLTVSMILFGLSILAGLYIALNQSENYRLYRRISRKIAENTQASTEEMDDSVIIGYSKKIETIEERNGKAFIFQLATFFVGLVIMAVTVLAALN